MFSSVTYFDDRSQSVSGTRGAPPSISASFGAAPAANQYSYAYSSSGLQLPATSSAVCICINTLCISFAFPVLTCFLHASAIKASASPMSLPSAAPAPAPELPPGWERRVTQDGHVYYADTNTKTTHWKPPSINQAYTQVVQARQQGQRYPVHIMIA
jgi:hypothetical protein